MYPSIWDKVWEGGVLNLAKSGIITSIFTDVESDTEG